MTITPVFADSLARLKQSLRLSGVVDGDGEIIIEDAVSSARTQLYNYLGLSQVNTLLTTALIDNPTTPEQINRSLAARIETKMVRRELLRTMPSLFMNGISVSRKAWNEEGLTRDASALDIEAETQRLSEEINSGLALLAGASPPASTINVSVIGPAYRNRAPGDGIYETCRARVL